MLEIIVLVSLASSLALTSVSCAALKSEFTTTGTTNAVPPVTTQLSAASTVAGEVLPAPYGTLTAAILNLIGVGAAAFATFHARRAASTNAATIAAALDVPPPALPPKTG